MSKQSSPMVKKLAAGAALVALSGFVPQPLVSPAHADTATINAAGTFAGGISLTFATNILFGSVIANGNTGKLAVTASTAAVTPTTASNGFFNGGEQQGSFLFNAAAGGLPVSVSVAGFTAALALSDKGEGTQGSITLNTMSMSGPFAAPIVLKAATPLKTVALTGTTGAAVTTDITAGARVTWSGARPIGGFSVPLTVTITY